MLLPRAEKDWQWRSLITPTKGLLRKRSRRCPLESSTTQVRPTFLKLFSYLLLLTLLIRPKLPQPTQPCKILPSPVISVTPKTANQNVRVVNPTKPLPKRLTLQLIPLDPTIANAISRHGHNPYLQCVLQMRTIKFLLIYILTQINLLAQEINLLHCKTHDKQMGF